MKELNKKEKVITGLTNSLLMTGFLGLITYSTINYMVQLPKLPETELLGNPKKTSLLYHDLPRTKDEVITKIHINPELFNYKTFEQDDGRTTFIGPVIYRTTNIETLNPNLTLDREEYTNTRIDRHGSVTFGPKSLAKKLENKF